MKDTMKELEAMLDKAAELHTGLEQVLWRARALKNASGFLLNEWEGAEGWQSEEHELTAAVWERFDDVQRCIERALDKLEDVEPLVKGEW